MYYIYEGTGTYTDGDETYPVQAGDVLFCNDGETHGIANESNAPLRFVALMQATRIARAHNSAHISKATVLKDQRRGFSFCMIVCS